MWENGHNLLSSANLGYRREQKYSSKLVMATPTDGKRPGGCDPTRAGLGLLFDFHKFYSEHGLLVYRKKKNILFL